MSLIKSSKRIGSSTKVEASLELVGNVELLVKGRKDVPNKHVEVLGIQNCKDSDGFILEIEVHKSTIEVYNDTTYITPEKEKVIRGYALVFLIRNNGLLCKGFLKGDEYDGIVFMNVELPPKENTFLSRHFVRETNRMITLSTMEPPNWSGDDGDLFGDSSKEEKKKKKLPEIIRNKLVFTNSHGDQEELESWVNCMKEVGLLDGYTQVREVMETDNLDVGKHGYITVCESLIVLRRKRNIPGDMIDLLETDDSKENFYSRLMRAITVMLSPSEDDVSFRSVWENRVVQAIKKQPILNNIFNDLSRKKPNWKKNPGKWNKIQVRGINWNVFPSLRYEGLLETSLARSDLAVRIIELYELIPEKDIRNVVLYLVNHYFAEEDGDENTGVFMGVKKSEAYREFCDYAGLKGLGLKTIELTVLFIAIQRYHLYTSVEIWNAIESAKFDNDEDRIFGEDDDKLFWKNKELWISEGLSLVDASKPFYENWKFGMPTPSDYVTRTSNDTSKLETLTTLYDKLRSQTKHFMAMVECTKERYRNLRSNPVNKMKKLDSARVSSSSNDMKHIVKTANQLFENTKKFDFGALLNISCELLRQNTRCDPIVREALKLNLRLLIRNKISKKEDSKNINLNLKRKRTSKLDNLEDGKTTLSSGASFGTILYLEYTGEWIKPNVRFDFDAFPRNQNEKGIPSAKKKEIARGGTTPSVEYITVQIDSGLIASFEEVNGILSEFLEDTREDKLLAGFKSDLDLAYQRFSMFSINDVTHQLFHKVVLGCYLSQKSVIPRSETLGESENLESKFHSTLQGWLNEIIKEEEENSDSFQINSELNPSVYIQFMKTVNAFIDLAGSYATSTFLLVSVLDILLNVRNISEVMKKEKEQSETTDNLCFVLGCQMSRIYNAIHDDNSGINKEDWLGYKDTITHILSGCKTRILLDILTISVVQRQKSNYIDTLRFFGIQRDHLEIQVCDRCYDTYYGCNQCMCGDSNVNQSIHLQDVSSKVDVHKKLVKLTKSYLG